MVMTKMILFSHPYDRFHDVWEAATATAALGHGIIDGAGYNKLPAILIEKLDHNRFNIFIGNNVAAAY
ncbi:hypothetical protein AVM02_14060 [Brucella anthropi]